jgi:hypothetical protein
MSIIIASTAEIEYRQETIRAAVARSRRTRAVRRHRRAGRHAATQVVAFPAVVTEDVVGEDRHDVGRERTNAEPCLAGRAS